jgi:hypothetical protein
LGTGIGGLGERTFVGLLVTNLKNYEIQI